MSLVEVRIASFFTISQFAVDLNNSNPYNQAIKFIPEDIFKVFMDLNRCKAPFVVGGYMAAAYHGLTRACKEIEIVSNLEFSLPPPFVIRVIDTKGMKSRLEKSVIMESPCKLP